MDEITEELNVDRLKEKALNRLGPNPKCVLCPEDDWRCLERHHLAGRAFDELTIVLCRNCHRKQSDPSDNNKAPLEPSIMERIAHFLLGLARFFLELARKFEEYGSLLAEGSRVCPSPWGSAS